MGRFAPTPSGELHAGNILCALLSYLSVKQKGGKYIVRIEDLDAVRCPRRAGERLLSVLRTFGLSGDDEPVWQSERTSAYNEKIAVLQRKAHLYPCYCSRAELHAAEAPRTEDGGVIYAGTCKRMSDAARVAAEKTRKPCLRIEVPDTDVCFTDGLRGEVRQNLRRACGDFILRRSDGVYAYQLAVVADDGDSGVTEVVRGDDLLYSTPRQIWLWQLLGYRTPAYYHIPLVCDATGRKLSKSEGDGITRWLQKETPQRILGTLGFAAGLLPQDRSTTLEELTALFSWEKVPRRAIRLPREFCE